MTGSNALGDILTTLLERKPFYRKGDAGGSLSDMCRALLKEDTEASGQQLASAILQRYRESHDEDRAAFYAFLNESLDVDADEIQALARAYGVSRSTETFGLLAKATEPARQELFRRLNQAPGATAELVRLRAKLLEAVRDTPDLGRTDHDLVHLLRSWFNRGFLVLRQITWDTPASVLEKIIAYEAVHEIKNWDDLRRRLQPQDRRCFAFFHPAMPDDPLIFVEVALSKGVPGSIQTVLSDSRSELPAEEADTAVFYSISNCQVGLAGISFGNSLIKQVVRDLSRDLPGLKKFLTLSPIPGLSKWLDTQGIDTEGLAASDIRQLAARYLLDAKTRSGKPLDPVARFHLANGAMVHMLHADADTSDKGLEQSHGVMVNYLYDPAKIPQNVDLFATGNEVVASTQVRTLAKQAAKKSHVKT